MNILLKHSMPFFYPAVTAFAVTVVLMPPALYLLKKFNIMDAPNARKIHSMPIPRMGGVVMYVAFALTTFLFAPCSISWKGIIIGAGIALLIGCADDIWGVPAIVKLFALFALTLFIWRFGIITRLPVTKLLGIHSEELNTACNLIITMLWLTGICSAINAIDHMDGLAAGISIVAAFAYLAVSIQSGQFAWGILAVALIGSLAGFLIFNFHPAKIFMGDSGSFFLGFSLAAIGIMGGWSTNPIKSIVIPIAVLSLPIFDLCFVIIRRKLNGTTDTLLDAVRYCGKDHIGHRLMNMRFTQPQALFLVCLVAVTIAISALVIRYTLFWESLLLFIQILMIYIILAVFMELATWNTIKVYYINKKKKK